MTTFFMNTLLASALTPATAAATLPQWRPHLIGYEEAEVETLSGPPTDNQFNFRTHEDCSR